MTGPRPEARLGMSGDYKFKNPKMYGPPLRLRVKGDGLQWHGPGRRPTPRNDLLYHSEWWAHEKDGVITNRVPKRKSKRRFPDLPPLKSG